MPEAHVDRRKTGSPPSERPAQAGVRHLGAHDRADERDPRPRGLRGQLLRIGDHREQRGARRDRLGHRRGRGVQARERGVVGLGERPRLPPAHGAQRRELVRPGASSLGKRNGEAVEVARKRQLARMAREERDERPLQGPQRQRGPEGQLVDDDVPRLDALQDRRQLRGHALGLPEHVVPARADLEGDRGGHAAPGGGEERAQVLALRGRPAAGAGDAVVVPRAEPQLDVLEAVGEHALAQRRARSPRPRGRRAARPSSASPK